MATLVLLPGLDGTGQLFSRFTDALDPSIQVVKVAYPPDEALDYAALASFASKHLPKDEPFFVLAESFSSPVGIAIAAAAPVGMQGLILSCGYARNPVPILAPLRFTTALMPVRAVPLGLISFFTLGRFATPALRGALDQALRSVDPSAIRARAKAALSVDVSVEMSRIKMPVLYLHARLDRIALKGSADQISALAPHTRIVEFSAPHFLLQVLPKEAAASIRAFMQECRPAP